MALRVPNRLFALYVWTGCAGALVSVHSNPKGTFLTAMTTHSSHVEFYMTKRTFLTVFFAVCVSAQKTPFLVPHGAIFNRFCPV